MLRSSQFLALLGALLIAAPLAAQPLVYVTDPSANTVTAINSGTNTIERTMPGIEQARAVAISPDGTRVYVAANGSSGAGIVAVIDGTKVSDHNVNPIINTIKVGGNPVALGYDAEAGLLYVADATSKQVNAYQLDGLDAANPEPSARYSGGNSLDAMALSPSGQMLALASSQDHSVTLYNLHAIAAGQTGKSILALDSAPQAIGFSALGDKLWVATAGGFDVYTPATGTVVSTLLAGGTNSIVLAPRANHVYFGTDAGDVYMFTPGSPIIATIGTNGPVSGLALSADGTRLYVVQNCSNCGLTVVDTATGQAIRQVVFGTAPKTAGQFAGPGDIYAANGSASGQAGEQLSASVTASDYSSRPLSYAQIQAPVQGQLSFNSTGDFTYSPPIGYSGIQSFVWEATALIGEGSPNEPRSRPITLTLNILPTLSTIGNQTGESGSTLGPLTFSITGTKPLVLKLNSSNSDLVDAGKIEVSAGCGTSSLSCSLQVPIKDVENGNSTITFTVIGPEGLTASSSFKITVGNGNNDSGGGAVTLFILGSLVLLAGLVFVRRRKLVKAHDRI